MPSPFPGMNPYLEHPTLWSGVHHRLITAIANNLAPQIRPKYIVAIEERVYQISGEESLLVGIPDVSIQSSSQPHSPTESKVSPTITATQPIDATISLPEILTESYLEIRSTTTEEVITAIEILSPKNKQSIMGRLQYETKRQKILGSDTHLVEIDLLRQGKPMPILSPNIVSNYRLLVSRSETRPRVKLYSFNLPDPIPQLPIPLRSEDGEVWVDLQELIHQIYDQGSYDLRIDYRQPPVPKLSSENVAWLENLLQQQ